MTRPFFRKEEKLRLRRSFSRLLHSALIAASLSFPPAILATERIVDLGSAQEKPQEISREALLASLKKADFILLGELHDNPRHHAGRGALIADLRPAAVVAEHLMRGQSAAADGELLPRLEAGGFEAKGWRWPMHEALFSPVVSAQIPLLGGNLPKPLVRQIAREGEAAIPQELAGTLTRFPLPAAAVEQVDRDLITGHCGQLAPAMLPGLRLAQRVRDGAMAATLAERTEFPAVLVAGNGHVRRDYGVPTLLAELAPQRSQISIGFIEDGPEIEARLPELRAQYDVVWITAPAERDDPCLTLRMPKQVSP
ncbi:MAG: ChaN family lipoprotein [Azonexus sp.]